MLCEEAKKTIKAKIDPSQQKQLKKNQILENNFQAIAEKWISEQKSDWSDSHYQRITSYLGKDVYPFIGSREISSIEAPELIALILKVSNRGSVDAAKRVKGFIQQVFDYALAHDKTNRNPAKDVNLRMILPKTIKKHYASVKDPVVLSQLLRSIDEITALFKLK